jgi:hypothetical protein
MNMWDIFFAWISKLLLKHYQQVDGNMHEEINQLTTDSCKAKTIDIFSGFLLNQMPMQDCFNFVLKSLIARQLTKLKL